MQNIEELNLITENIEVTPKYNLENKTTSINVYFHDNGQVLIVGTVDNNYIYWASLTDSSDEEINRSIFDYIARGRIRKTSHIYKVIESKGFSLKELKRWVKISLTRKEGEPMYWITPFITGNYSSEQDNGIFFARDIAHYMEKVHEKCCIREADGAYEKVLDYYLDVMKEDDGNSHYYTKVSGIEEILRSEEYLYGSQNPKIRGKYIELRERLDSLYNRYMSAVR